MSAMGRTRGTCICVAVLCAGAALAGDPPDYARDVQPIFASRCYSCHGSKAQMHGLRLDRKADALRGGNSGAPSIIPGDSTQSLLLKYVSGSDGDVIMPPAGERLKPAEIDILRRWIDSGALWPGDQETAAPKLRSNHWAFQPVAHPAV